MGTKFLHNRFMLTKFSHYVYNDVSLLNSDRKIMSSTLGPEPQFQIDYEICETYCKSTYCKSM